MSQGDSGNRSALNGGGKKVKVDRPNQGARHHDRAHVRSRYASAGGRLLQHERCRTHFRPGRPAHPFQRRFRRFPRLFRPRVLPAMVRIGCHRTRDALRRGRNPAARRLAGAESVARGVGGKCRIPVEARGHRGGMGGQLQLCPGQGGFGERIRRNPDDPGGRRAQDAGR